MISNMICFIIYFSTDPVFRVHSFDSPFIRCSHTTDAFSMQLALNPWLSSAFTPPHSICVWIYRYFVFSNNLLPYILRLKQLIIWQTLKMLLSVCVWVSVWAKENIKFVYIPCINSIRRLPSLPAAVPPAEIRRFLKYIFKQRMFKHRTRKLQSYTCFNTLRINLLKWF